MPGRLRRNPQWTIEFLCAGHGCTLPPSIHPDTGNRYTWVNGGLSKIGPPPDALLRAFQTAEPASNPSPGGWPKREPINAELKPVPPFDPALLPEALRPWIMDEAERMPCPPDFIAAAAIVMISSIVGARSSQPGEWRHGWNNYRRFRDPSGDQSRQAASRASRRNLSTATRATRLIPLTQGDL